MTKSLPFFMFLQLKITILLKIASIFIYNKLSICNKLSTHKFYIEILNRILYIEKLYFQIVKILNKERQTFNRSQRDITV